jgi:hypothetical protein
MITPVHHLRKNCESYTIKMECTSLLAKSATEHCFSIKYSTVTNAAILAQRQSLLSQTKIKKIIYKSSSNFSVRGVCQSMRTGEMHMRLCRRAITFPHTPQ